MALQRMRLFASAHIVHEIVIDCSRPATYNETSALRWKYDGLVAGDGTALCIGLRGGDDASSAFGPAMLTRILAVGVHVDRQVDRVGSRLAGGCYVSHNATKNTNDVAMQTSWVVFGCCNSSFLWRYYLCSFAELRVRRVE